MEIEKMTKNDIVNIMDEVKKIWMDGKLVNWGKAKIHVMTHSLHYGTGVFEGIRCYRGSNGSFIFRLEEHINRLLYSADCIGMRLSFTNKDLKSAVLEIIKSNKLDECYVRPIAFYGYGSMKLDPTKATVNVSIGAWPWHYKVGKNENMVSAKISKYMRLHPKSIETEAKVSGYYANSIFAVLDAGKFKVDEAIFLDMDGNIAEGPGENIFLVKDKILYTPALGSILPGITRDSVIKIAQDRGIRVVQKAIKTSELKKSDEAFFCGTAVEICPISSIDGKKIGKGQVGPITEVIRSEYGKIVRGEDKKYLKWLTPVK